MGECACSFGPTLRLQQSVTAVLFVMELKRTASVVLLFTRVHLQMVATIGKHIMGYSAPLSSISAAGARLPLFGQHKFGDWKHTTVCRV
jgi:hypothetical protein